MSFLASHSANHLAARATSGQLLDISYDPVSNALVFVEAAWSADGRGPAAPSSTHREVLPRLGLRPSRTRRRAG